MLKVWQNSKGTRFAECTSCGSYGSVHVAVERKLTPEIEKALEEHSARCMALRGHYIRATNLIMAKVRSHELPRAEAVEQVRTLWGNHVAQVTMAESALPDPTGKVSHVVTKCPWCEAVHPEQEVEMLPDDVAEPDYQLAIPVKAYMADQLAKQGNK